MPGRGVAGTDERGEKMRQHLTVKSSSTNSSKKMVQARLPFKRLNPVPKEEISQEKKQKVSHNMPSLDISLEDMENGSEITEFGALPKAVNGVGPLDNYIRRTKKTCLVTPSITIDLTEDSVGGILDENPSNGIVQSIPTTGNVPVCGTHNSVASAHNFKAHDTLSINSPEHSCTVSESKITDDQGLSSHSMEVPSGTALENTTLLTSPVKTIIDDQDISAEDSPAGFSSTSSPVSTSSPEVSFGNRKDESNCVSPTCLNKSKEQQERKQKLQAEKEQQIRVKEEVKLAKEKAKEEAKKKKEEEKELKAKERKEKKEKENQEKAEKLRLKEEKKKEKLEDAVDRRLDSLSKSIFSLAGASLRPAFASAWVARVLTAWLQHHHQDLSEQDVPADTLDFILQMSQASKYLCEASMEIGSLFARISALSVIQHREVWLKVWDADASSKRSLANLPFEGSRLFGAQLDEFISAATGGKSTHLPQPRTKRPFRSRASGSRVQSFRRFSTARTSSSSSAGGSQDSRKKPFFKPQPSWRPLAQSARPPAPKQPSA
ncbi:chromatin assembly factor 1 subunit A-B-like [Bufo bufo]|uniref:chromatin assembly factor 1 subunit A-B-like n=1 Tax=Bufo bufo TaxID=8384 RepID=UPI001ABDFB5C|nr:chromatin assembly factor 1 subunit A-B-like [Bufo bufo]